MPLMVPALWNDFAPVETLASLDALDLTKLDTGKRKLEDEVDAITEAAGPARMSTN